MAVDATAVGSLAGEFDVLGRRLAEEFDALGALRTRAFPGGVNNTRRRQKGKSSRILTLRFGSSIALYHSSASGVVERMTSVRPSLYFLVWADSYVGATLPSIL